MFPRWPTTDGKEGKEGEQKCSTHGFILAQRHMLKLDKFQAPIAPAKVEKVL